MNVFKKLVLSNEGRLFFVGDIHGEYLALQNKIKQVNFDFSKDHLVFVGDLIDRGAEIKNVIEMFLNTDCFHGVMGNHDFSMFFEKQETHWRADERNGSVQTISQLGEEGLKYYSKQLLKKMSVILQVEKNGKKFGVIHGGIPFDNNKPDHWKQIIKRAKKCDQYKKNLLWDRTVLAYYRPDILANKRLNGNIRPPTIKGIDLLIHGHTTLAKPEKFEQRYYIDTFAQSEALTFLMFNQEQDEMIFL